MGWAASCLNSLFLQLCAEKMPFHIGEAFHIGEKKKSISITEIINIEIRGTRTEGGQRYRGCLGQQQSFGTNLNSLLPFVQSPSSPCAALCNLWGRDGAMHTMGLSVLP